MLLYCYAIHFRAALCPAKDGFTGAHSSLSCLPNFAYRMDLFPAPHLLSCTLHPVQHTVASVATAPAVQTTWAHSRCAGPPPLLQAHTREDSMAARLAAAEVGVGWMRTDWVPLHNRLVRCLLAVWPARYPPRLASRLLQIALQWRPPLRDTVVLLGYSLIDPHHTCGADRPTGGSLRCEAALLGAAGALRPD